MTFIDQTIVSIAVPNIQRELGLTSTGVQWVVNGYLISLACAVRVGRPVVGHLRPHQVLRDRRGHLRVASTMCGLTPKGSGAEAWIVDLPRRSGAPVERSCSRARSW